MPPRFVAQSRYRCGARHFPAASSSFVQGRAALRLAAAPNPEHSRPVRSEGNAAHRDLSACGARAVAEVADGCAGGSGASSSGVAGRSEGALKSPPRPVISAAEALA